MVGTDADAGMVGGGRFQGGSGGWSQQNRSRGFWDMPLTRVQAGRQPVLLWPGRPVEAVASRRPNA